MLFSLQKEDLYSADFLLATLSPALDSTVSVSSRTAKHEVSTSNHPSPVPTLRNKTGNETGFNTKAGLLNI